MSPSDPETSRHSNRACPFACTHAVYKDPLSFFELTCPIYGLVDGPYREGYKAGRKKMPAIDANVYLRKEGVKLPDRNKAKQFHAGWRCARHELILEANTPKVVFDALDYLEDQRG